MTDTHPTVDYETAMSNVFMDNVSEDHVYCRLSSGNTLFTLIHLRYVVFPQSLKCNKIISVEGLSSLLGHRPTMFRFLFC